ncbi:hypothetical protein [Methylogaea oryzae]|uniref:hypothetical protein n=1 Tax=Methylogaea oryzae TaxID=1295382 RepID=UPI0006CFC299|nr:hypothetical protein [Methylogaea oryzae]
MTGKEAIFGAFRDEALTPLQWYLLQWLEIENRAMAFLAEHGLASRCFTLRVPEDLNDAEQIERLLAFHGLTRRPGPLRRPRRRNLNPFQRRASARSRSVRPGRYWRGCPTATWRCCVKRLTAAAPGESASSPWRRVSAIRLRRARRCWDNGRFGSHTG